MFILGVVLVFLAWAVPQLLAVPAGVISVVGGLGWLLIVLGFVLFVLAMLGISVGRGIGPARANGRRYWY